MTERKPQPSIGAVIGLVLTILTIAGILCSVASGLQSKFDDLDARQQRIESKVDALMTSFHVEYVPAEASTAKATHAE